MTITKTDKREVRLMERGWQITANGRWRHPNLTTEWPAEHAIRLQTETDKGMQDQAHRMLRGEL